MSLLLVKMGCRFLLIFAERSRKSLRTMSAEIRSLKGKMIRIGCPLSLHSLSEFDLEREHG